MLLRIKGVGRSRFSPAFDGNRTTCLLVLELVRGQIPAPVRKLLRPLRSAYYGATDTRSRRESVFRGIFANNSWGGAQSSSGPGSDMEQTAVIRRELPALFERLNIRTLVDAPCGDLGWMKHVQHELSHYTGCDIVPELISSLQVSSPWPNSEFYVRDIVVDDLPTADAILCRDCLVHLNFQQIRSAVMNFKRSGYTYLITTTFTSRSNYDIPTGRWRPLNLQDAPFRFPDPIELLIEGCTQGNGAFSDKSLGVWRLDLIQTGRWLP
jgi:hypothetical protein